MPRAAVSFTGGKDCTVSLCLAKEQGYEIALLITFGPRGGVQSFKAHALDLIRLQAKALNIPHIVVEIGEEGKTYLQCYREELQRIKEQYQIDVLVTGDILNVCDNFMAKASKDIIELVCPIWGWDRPRLLEELFRREFDIMITCASLPKLGGQQSLAREFVGARLTPAFMKSHLEPRKDEVDMGGEWGEFHTMVLTVPGLYNGYRIEYQGEPIIDGDYMFMDFKGFNLVPSAST
ncbi:hypothetical protein BGZ73_006821 [Actinomortierella ambigua]|nr:hypothetical protein BGZ73_006821 [Actinomortierella ambigua]